MFIVNPRPAQPLPSTRDAAEPVGVRPAVPAPSAPATPFAQSAFEVGAAPRAPTAPYFPTNAELTRPTPAYVVNITNGERQPLNPSQMSTEQGIAFVQQRLAGLGYGGPGVAANTTFPTSGPFRIDYNGDDRQHWDIDGMNVALTLQLYANNPPEVADRMVADNMKYARRTPSFDGNEIPPQLLAPPAQQPQFAPMRVLPGTTYATPAQRAAIGPYTPTRAELDRPTTATSLNILTGARTPLNPAQMSNDQGVAFVQQRLAALGYSGAGTVSNQTAPQSGPFGIDYGTDDRRHWDIDGMNVGLTLGLYANNPPEVADRMLYAMLHPR